MVDTNIDEELEAVIEGAPDDEIDTKNPQNVRAGAKAQAEVRDEEELARNAEEAASIYGENLETQHDRAKWFEDLEDRLSHKAAGENLPVTGFLADAQATGKAELNDEWGFEASEYLEEDGEPLEFAQEDQGLFEYFHDISGEIDNLTQEVITFTNLMGNVSDKQEAYVQDVEQQLEEAEREKEERIEQAVSEYEEQIEEAEEEKEEEVDRLKDQVSNQSTTDVEGSSYEDTSEMWETEWSDISNSFNSTKEEFEEEKEEKIEEAKSEYRELEEELEEEKSEKLEDFQEQRETLRGQKQEAVSDRAERLDELEEVHVEFSNDVEDYIERQADALKDITITLRSLENMNQEYKNNSVEADEELRGSLNQDQQGVAGEISEAAISMANRALTRIDYLEDAMTDYGRADEAITDMLDEQDARVGSRLEEFTELYEDLGVEVDEEDEYGIEGLRQRVRNHVENATDHEYDALDEFQLEIESMMRAP